MAKDWGKITWFLFHGMLEKISNENFVKHRIMIIELIVEICSLLPCPTCQQHATNHVKFIHRVSIVNFLVLVWFICRFTSEAAFLNTFRTTY